MLELVAFPFLPSGEPVKAVSALIKLCREMPAQGEQFRFFRRRLKDLRLWDDQLVDGTLLFLGIPKSGNIRPSQLSRNVGGLKSEDKARDLLAERLWEANPLLLKSVIEYLKERVYSRDELIKYLHSFAYRGKQPTRPQLEAWLHLALGLKLLKMVGVALDLDDRGKAFLERAAELDVEEFLAETAAGEDGAGGDGDASGDAGSAEDAPGGAGEGGPEDVDDGGPVGVDDDADAGPAGDSAGSPPRAQTAPARPAALRPARPVEPASAASMDVSGMKSPRGRERPVDASRFAGRDVFPEDVLSETGGRIQAWWAEQSAQRQGLGASEFGFEAEAWMENAEELLYRVAVAAALVFRLHRDRAGVIQAFEALDDERAGVLRDLYYGTAPETLPQEIDAQALMLASLLARRFAEAPDLASTLEKQTTAAEAFAVLERALGRGLLRIELFWMMGALADLGALRLEDLGDYTALPRRLVRDTLFRLGYLGTPYAHDAASLVPAARAARRAAGTASPPDEVIAAFALTAGCAYDCPNRRSCEHACRERAE
jgi:hypothetical protein